jgi:hypothetical protein
VTPRQNGSTGDDPRRRAKRRNVETASCETGDLLDLSPLGMRLSVPTRSAPRPGSVLVFRLKAPEGVVAVSGRVAWRKRAGLMRCQIGVEFVQLSPTLTVALHSLAEFGCLTATAAEPTAASGRSKTSGPNHRRPSTASLIPVDMPDLYEMLELDPDSSEDDIHAAYRGLAKKLHPDLNPDPEAADRFIMICKAYEILSDPSMRAAYDLRRAA